MTVTEAVQAQAPDSPEFRSGTFDFSLQETGKIMSAVAGYDVDLVVDDSAPTFYTSYNPETEGVRVGISPELLARVEAEDHLDFFCFAITHETGHVKKFIERPPTTERIAEAKYQDFDNIIDDIADNQALMRKTRYFADLIPGQYDQVLFPANKRPDIANKPRHIQFTNSLLMLSMMAPAASTEKYDKEQLADDLDDLGISSLSEEVVQALTEAITYDINGQRYNLLRLLRTHGDDYDQRERTSALLQEMYDALYEEDVKDQGDGNGGQSGQGQGESTNFDYSESGSCGHEHQSDPSTEADGGKEAEENAQESKTTWQRVMDKVIGGQQVDSASQEDAPESGSQDIRDIAVQIAQQIEQAHTEGKDEQDRINEEARKQAEAEARQRMQQDLKLSDEDFAGYLSDRTRYAGEIDAFADIVSRLKRERLDSFLAPSQDTKSRGHRIDVPKLVGFVASGSKSARPDIFRSPRLSEKLEHEFDGLDMFLLCDISDSMNTGGKAREAAASFAVILEGLRQADEIADHEDLVQVQIQAFGYNNYTLSPLDSRPSTQSIGQTYAKIRRPNEGTYASESLRIASQDVSSEPHLPHRLQVVSVISDGEFADVATSKQEAQKIEDNGGIILQFVYGGASVSQLSEKAHVIHLDGAASLPERLFELIPDLMNELRSYHA